MLLQNGPADTLWYMVFGYAVILGTMGLFILSLVVRVRNLRRELDTLEQIETES